jgi:hypothetical protein
MKKFFTTISLAIAILPALAQQQEKCASMTVLQQQLQNAQLANRYRQSNAAASEWRTNHPGEIRSAAPVLTIPVVVHVLYKNASQNISDQQIYSQIAILNQDYRRMNADTVNTPLMFDTIAADINIEFCLATLDPQGNPTNGITRTSTTGGLAFGFFSPFGEDAKFDSTGGKNAWPTDRYLNIWVCELFPGLLGYAQFPGGAAATDGVVVTYTAFGNTGTVTAPSLLGRTATHEVGHWLGLYHIWGDDQDCTGSDSIADTPNADQASSSDCQVNRNSCSNEDAYWGSFDPNDMVQNYMDYSHDSCMNMFTNGQKARIYSFLYTDSLRLSLFTSNGGCNPLGISQQATFDQYFSLYPNPANGIINVSYFGQWSCDMIVDVMDITGNVVGTSRVNTYSYQLDLSSYAAGLYTLRFTGEGGTAAKRIVLQ